MKPKEILLVLTNQWADWEAAYATASLHAFFGYAVKTIAVDKEPKVSMGGLRAAIDYTIDEYDNHANLAMLILPGGASWQEESHNEIAAFVKKAIDSKIPVAAICGATIFLGRHGLLDNVKHTGDELALFQEHDGYNGQDFYIQAQVALDGGIITANETAAVEFARTIFGVLDVDSAEGLDGWYECFKNGAVQ